MKSATITVDVSGNNGGFGMDEGARRLAYTEEVRYDQDIAKTLIRVANLIHPGALLEMVGDRLRSREEALKAQEARVARHQKALDEIIASHRAGDRISRAEHALNALNLILGNEKKEPT